MAILQFLDRITRNSKVGRWGQVHGFCLYFLQLILSFWLPWILNCSSSWTLCSSMWSGWDDWCLEFKYCLFRSDVKMDCEIERQTEVASAVQQQFVVLRRELGQKPRLSVYVHLCSSHHHHELLESNKRTRFWMSIPEFSILSKYLYVHKYYLCDFVHERKSIYYV